MLRTLTQSRLNESCDISLIDADNGTTYIAVADILHMLIRNLYLPSLRPTGQQFSECVLIHLLFFIWFSFMDVQFKGLHNCSKT